MPPMPRREPPMPQRRPQGLLAPLVRRRRRASQRPLPKAPRRKLPKRRTTLRGPRKPPAHPAPQPKLHRRRRQPEHRVRQHKPPKQPEPPRKRRRQLARQRKHSVPTARLRNRSSYQTPQAPQPQLPQSLTTLRNR
jgi:hypothetical protein